MVPADAGACAAGTGLVRACRFRRPCLVDHLVWGRDFPRPGVWTRDGGDGLLRRAVLARQQGPDGAGLAEEEQQAASVAAPRNASVGAELQL